MNWSSHPRKKTVFFALLFVTLSFFSCKSTKHLENGESLLTKSKVTILSEEKRGISESALEDIIRPRPNSKLLFMRVNLAFHNLYSPERTKEKERKKEEKCRERRNKRIKKIETKIRNNQYYRNLYPEQSSEYQKYDARLKKAQNKRNKHQNNDCERTLWTRRIGEAPVLYKPSDRDRNTRQIRAFLRNRGYYYPDIQAEVTEKKNQKTQVEYFVKPGKPYIIDTIKYDIKDDTLRNIILNESEKSLIKQGDRLEVNLLQKERDRITEILRNQGYYRFTKNFVSFEVDTTSTDRTALLNLIVSMPQSGNQTVPHKQYVINKVNVWPDYEPRKALANKEDYYKQFTQKRYIYEDRLFHFHTTDDPKLKPRSVMQGIYIHADSLYRLPNIRATYRQLTSMEIIRIANIDFEEVTDSTELPFNHDPQTGYLNCNIKISNTESQARTFEIEGTNSNGNLGAAGSVIYTHRNIFKSAEVFNFSLKGSLERQTNYDEQDVIETDLFFNSREISGEAGLKIPRFLAPLRLRKFIKRSSPGTEILMNYSYLQRPEYTRTVAGLSFGYFWKSSPVIEHLFRPVFLDFIDLTNPTPGFLNYIERYNLQGSYEDHFVFGSSYSFVYNNSHQKERRNHFYFRSNLKLAGNSLAAVMNLIEGNNEPGKGFNNNVFAQFTKLDFDIRHYRRIPGTENKLVFRLFSGAALPYGNLEVVPFGEKYFGGGSNGLRAWQVRALGPGSYTYQDETDRFPNRTADIKLEANFEYRIPLFWRLEGAFFIDAGNIWAINTGDDRQGALFEFSDFYKEVAIGTGIGFRADFDFFIVRIDLGLKLKDPADPEGERWIPLNRGYNNDDWTFNIGIGYPF